MKPITNVFPAREGSEKGYSVNRSESTLMEPVLKKLISDPGILQCYLPVLLIKVSF